MAVGRQRPPRHDVQTRRRGVSLDGCLQLVVAARHVAGLADVEAVLLGVVEADAAERRLDGFVEREHDLGSATR